MKESVIFFQVEWTLELIITIQEWQLQIYSSFVKISIPFMLKTTLESKNVRFKSAINKFRFGPKLKIPRWHFLYFFAYAQWWHTTICESTIVYLSLRNSWDPLPLHHKLDDYNDLVTIVTCH